MDRLVSDLAFTDSVKARQARHGSREMFAKQLATQDWQRKITPELAAYIAARDSFYMATVSETGWPYIQHRGGPRGFLHVMDDQTLGFADFSGNRQYISAGNLDRCDRAHLFFTDYANQQRIKLWGRARMVDDDTTLIERLVVPGYRARPERAVLVTVQAWDVNCPQHIPELHSVETIQTVTSKLSARIAELEAENAELKGWLGK